MKNSRFYRELRYYRRKWFPTKEEKLEQLKTQLLWELADNCEQFFAVWRKPAIQLRKEGLI